jgi:GMP synthase (glutamine-hydrolysing)|tara:strand:- start:772 stop:1479 length:708 start_codon:yes stop_codon:yes gene_type:complete
LPQKIILVEHNPEPRDNGASIWLAEQGFKLHWCQPFAGERLPSPTVEVAGVVILGGSQNIDEMSRSPFLADEACWLETCLAQQIPVLGLCLGGQLLAHVLGAHVGPREDGTVEFGFYPIQPAAQCADFVPDNFFVMQWHGRGFEVPAGAEALAAGEVFPNQAFRYGDTAYGLQFHPECTLSVLRRWQEYEGAPWDKPGAQNHGEQDRLAQVHMATMHEWFTSLLGRLFCATNPTI